MTFASLYNDLKEKKYRPVYFLMGEEAYFIDRLSDYLENNVLSAEEKMFDQQVLYGKDTDMENIIALARRFPMVAAFQVIIVKEAQMIRKLEPLETYLSRPMPTTILVFCYKYKKIDKRTRLAGLLNEKAVLFESNRLRDDKVPDWIISYLRERGNLIDAKAASLLVDFLGNDLGRIVNELEKLLQLLPGESKSINCELIEKYIGISREYNNFELTRALVANDALKANRIIRYFGKNPAKNPLTLTLTTLFYFFTKVLLYHEAADRSRENLCRELGINAFFLTEYQRASQRFSAARARQVITYLRECDIRSKGVGNVAPDEELLKELIYKILH